MKTTQAPSANYDAFIHMDTTPYKGEWIAIAKEKVVSHGKDAEKVYKKAKQKYSNKDISLAKVPVEEVLILSFSP